MTTAQHKPIVAVLDFKKEGVSDQEMKSIVSLLTSTLFRTGSYEVIDVTQRDALLKEIEFSMTCSDESCQIEIGKMLSAEFIVVGSLGRVGTKWILVIKMLQTATSRTLCTADGSYKDLDDLVEDIPQLVSKLTGVPIAVVPFNWNPILGTASLVTGLGALGAGGYFLYDAFTAQSSKVAVAQNAYEKTRTGTPAEFDALYSAYANAVTAYFGTLWIGIGGVAGGAILTSVAILYFLLPAEQPRATPKISLTIIPPRPGVPLAVGISIRKILP